MRFFIISAGWDNRLQPGGCLGEKRNSPASVLLFYAHHHTAIGRIEQPGTNGDSAEPDTLHDLRGLSGIRPRAGLRFNPSEHGGRRSVARLPAERPPGPACPYLLGAWG